MRIRKAVITAAGRNQRALPLQTIIDRDGNEKSVLCVLIEQALSAHIEEICVVVWPGDEDVYAQAAGNHTHAVRFVAQAQPLGYGNAIHSARHFTGGDPFLHMVGDHLYVSTSATCVERIVALAEAEECSVSGVQPTRESLLYRFGAVAGRRISGRTGLYRVDTVIEKPTPTEAEQHLMVAGIRAGLLSLLLRHPCPDAEVMDLLERGRSRGRYALRRAGRTGPATNSISRSKRPAAATTSARAMAC